MIKKLIISLLVLHGIYITISNSFISNDLTRTLEKANPLTTIVETQKLLKEGDMVLRLNMDSYSQFIKNFNRLDKQYSHAGIVIIENGHHLIYHMVNGEENQDHKMIKTSFEEFVNPKRNYAFGVYRNDFSENEKEAFVVQLLNWYNKEIKFDFELNLESDDKMYCSEMIAKAITKATNKRIKINTSKLRTKEAVAFAAYSKLPLNYTKNLEVIAIDNLYKHQWCKVVKEYKFY